jgi:hypothetical protein
MSKASKRKKRHGNIKRGKVALKEKPKKEKDGEEECTIESIEEGPIVAATDPVIEITEKKGIEIHKLETGEVWYKKMEKAIRDGDKEELETLIKALSGNINESDLIKLTYLKWVENRFENRKWTLGRQFDNCPLCKYYVGKDGSCTNCPLFKIEGTECLKADFYDETREGKKDLILKRLQTLIKDSTLISGGK